MTGRVTGRSPRASAGVIALGLVMLAGCGDQQVNPASPVITLTPPANPSSEPTTSGSPVPPDVPAPTVVDTVAAGLQAPWGLGFLPDGDAIVTERDTEKVLRISAGERRVTQIGSVDLASPGGEGGLLGVAVSPDFASDSLLYFYATTDDDNRVVKATLSAAGLGPVEEVFTGIPNGQIHDGGRLAFGPDGYLYVSTGEGGQSERAQDRENLGGKILRITTSGDPAPGNPFGTAVYTYGHRNVQGLAFSADGQLWASEFGANAFDELNRIDAGSDYGWPEIEGAGGTDQGYVDPQATWSTDVASPSGLAFAGGALWMAALRGSRLWRIPVITAPSGDPTGNTVGTPQAFFVGDYGRMRTVALAPDGNLWVTTSNTDGRGDPSEGDDQILVIAP